MADLLIRGMALPQSNDEKIIIYSDGTAINFDFGEGLKHKESKAVELPDHGRLGDLDEIWKLLKEEKYPETQIASETDNDDRYWMIGKNAGVNAFRRVCQNLQTIIPASKEGGE